MVRLGNVCILEKVQQIDTSLLDDSKPFVILMEDNSEICQRLLEILLHIKIEKLSPPKSEWTMQESVSSKGVRFDVYMDNLSHGEKYIQLKESYVIFLCLFDPFDGNHPVYFFENSCRDDDKIKLNDGAYKVFFNASDYAKMENDEEKNFFKFLSGQDADGDFARTIEEKGL